MLYIKEIQEKLLTFNNSFDTAYSFLVCHFNWYKLPPKIDNSKLKSAKPKKKFNTAQQTFGPSYFVRVLVSLTF